MMKSYQRLILIKLLDLSIDKYGPYTLGVFDQEVAVRRVREEVALGRYAHIDFSAMTQMSDEFEEKTEQKELPIFNHILGLRKLIIRKSASRKFTNINDKTAFLKFSAGQGSGWQDVSIYENAGIKVVETVKYTSLFPMLSKYRFDYLPLSIIEIDEALKKQKSASQDLQIQDDLYIFYHIPFYINITKRYPLLSERIRYGVKRLIETKGIKPAFDLFFKNSIEKISPSRSKVFVMDNPWLEQAENQRAIKQMMALYFNKNTMVFNLNDNVSVATQD